jgi:tRNA (guanine-N7-)-methyltransferase
VSRSLKYDIPGEDWRIVLEEAAEHGLEAVFAQHVPVPLSLVVEIGFGRGEFLMALAEAEPKTAFLGVEYSFKRTLKLARRIARTPLRNIRLLAAPAERVLHELLRDASVSDFWINYPDPWPKKRHAKRRLLQPKLAELLARRLVPDGLLHVATDHPDYAEWIDGVLCGVCPLENCYAPDRYRREVPGRPPTAYELEWRALGRPLHYFEYRRRHAPSEAAA